MTSRSYLSIGDVLTLLRQEFPDVTISKIRFLESQGLVNPERTPSGYRKFYEHDVERLRWVLRQQRENFLPLKVIKDRLEDDANGTTRDPVSAEEIPSDGAGEEPDWHADTRERELERETRDEPVLVGQRAAGSAVATGATASGPNATVEHRATSPRRGATLPGIEGAASRATTGEELAGTPDAPIAPVAPIERSQPVAAVPPERSEPTRAQAAEPAAGKRAARSESGAATGEGSRRRQSPGRQASGPAGAAPAPPPDGGASLSLEDLSAASGLDADVLRELQSYGLLTATPVAGLDYFDQEALAVATVAAGFARFGVEPRHLRLYKNAADREAGFVEQIVLPLVRQRNPEARAKANETADVLAGLGQELRTSLLRLALRGLLEG